MTHSGHADPLRAVIQLDQKVRQARTVLQHTRESHPQFERRVAALVELVARRDRVLTFPRVETDRGKRGPWISEDTPPAA